jgi:hypothetical protein
VRPHLTPALVATLIVWHGPAGAAPAGSPAETVKAYFAAAAQKDYQAMKKLTVGRAHNLVLRLILRNNPHHQRFHTALGASFDKVTDVKITGQRATAVALQNQARLAAMLWQALRVNLVNVAPRLRPTTDDHYRQLARKYALGLRRLRVMLVNKGGSWRISDVKRLQPAR